MMSAEADSFIFDRGHPTSEGGWGNPSVTESQRGERRSDSLLRTPRVGKQASRRRGGKR